ncbi:sulfite exporter TauE/SafE family protein [Paenactinomyces guangxiensis]|uniref:Probable membrane transporter protein n=1 Tax=Paenactinomyces guangxiensis TaxID=1490290 RepID=A0A7W2A758_9BACL|nr:sulfite exporter TauE/SafE family protein [Paenactinomyces guangxiensis]MBA4492782.1 sulfite exporter TauE/SafE family protein [Paenactinomyces guangxiensis]MBH8590369.1 sulfite exporter TauE/SafE family protein [Paenactinomyces guangxiensis]
MILAIVGTGFVVGFLVGLTGMGGGLLMTPLLILLYGFSPTMAVGTDLIYAATTKAFGSYQHFRQKTVDWGIVKKLAQGSIPGGIAGVLMIRLLDRTTSLPVEEVLGHILGITFIFVSLFMLSQLLKRHGQRPAKPAWKVPIRLVGLLGGLLVGLTSVGSGTLFMVVLLSSTSLSAALLVGTDVVHAFFLTLSAGVLHASMGHVDWSFVSWLLVGSIPGILLGGRLTLRVPELLLRLAIILVLLFTGIKMV